MAFIQLGVATWYLYNLLNWSALLGFGVIVVLLPVPGYIGKLIANIQHKKMAVVCDHDVHVLCSRLPLILSLCRRTSVSNL